MLPSLLLLFASFFQSHTVLNGVNAMREIRAWESSNNTNTTITRTATSYNKRTAILGMSGHSLPIDIEAAKHAGMNAFLLKPLHPDTLVELIAVLVNDSANGTSTSYHQSLQSTTMQSNGSTSVSPRKQRANTLVSPPRGPIGNSCGTFTSNTNDDTANTSTSTNSTDSSAVAVAAALNDVDECALLKKQVALLQQGRKTVAAVVRPRHNTLM